VHHTLIVSALACSVLFNQTDATAFRGHLRNPAVSLPSDVAGIEHVLLAEIEDVLGKDHRKATERRLGRIEETLRPTFTAMPKNVHGRLEHSAVRYALHRLFVQRHAWFVSGLDPAGSSWNSSSSTAFLQDHVPELLTRLFEQRVGAKGFEIREVAVMAAILENLVHHEALRRLSETYRVLERSAQDPVSTDEARDVIDAYMTSYVLGLNYSEMNASQVEMERGSINEIYPGWPETQKFLREVEASTIPKGRQELTFENIATVVEEIGERYGRWQDHECRSLKSELLHLEDRGTGRVRLADFYGSAVNEGKWQFSESVPYLRELGALDESDPADMRVIIPNYIYSPSNCVASSKYYSVCCVDECEDLLGHIEEQLRAPAATPTEIVAIVSKLSSPTVAANGNISDLLLRRLDEIAQHHGGNSVPLHGRLFAQWMHNVYPRECRYPHITGTISPQRAEDWIAMELQPAATEEEMKLHIASSQPRTLGDVTSGGIDEDAGACGAWTLHEELVAEHPRAVAASATSGKGILRGVALVAAVVSAALALAHFVELRLSSRRKSVLPKYC